MIFDSHCHSQFPQYKNDREEMIQRALDGGVFMICVGTDLETSKSSIELAQKHEGIWASVGLHPNDNLNEKFEPDKYRELLKQDNVVAFAEIGLDYYRTEKPEDQKFQKERFIQQLELAKELKRPLILHCRDVRAGSIDNAYKDMIDIFKNDYALNGGVIHSFTGTIDEAKQFV